MKKYNVIYADPAWGFNKGVYQDNGRKDRLIDEQYPTMTKKELQQLPVKDIADKDCALFLWVTDSHLKEGIELMETWIEEHNTSTEDIEKIKTIRKSLQTV